MKSTSMLRKDDSPMNETLYKVLNEDATPSNGGSGQWHRNGKWMPHIEDIEPCSSGYHLCRPDDLLHWLGPSIWEAEYKGERIDCEDKIVVQQARIVRRLNWNDRIARLYACDCAERVLHIADDERCNNAVEVARRYASGEATRKELAAAWEAARAAAWDAAGAAAWDARSAARDAAWDAARAAWAAAGDAWDAAGAAWPAAGNAERQWQTERLMKYIHGEIS